LDMKAPKKNRGRRRREHDGGANYRLGAIIRVVHGKKAHFPSAAEGKKGAARNTLLLGKPYPAPSLTEKAKEGVLPIKHYNQESVETGMEWRGRGSSRGFRVLEGSSIYAKASCLPGCRLKRFRSLPTAKSTSQSCGPAHSKLRLMSGAVRDIPTLESARIRKGVEKVSHCKDT